MPPAESIEKRAAEFAERYKAVYKQLGRVIVGHDDIVHGVLTCLFVGGHCLLEGVPGLGQDAAGAHARADARPRTSRAFSSRPT